MIVSEDKSIASKSIRIPSELYDAVVNQCSKHGDMIKFVADAIRQSLKDKGSIINKCAFCVLSSRCDMKTMAGRTSCLFHVSPFSSMTCKHCINWDKTGRKCILIKKYGYGYMPNENDKCILTAFDPKSFQKGVEGREKERRDKTRQYVVVMKPLFKVDDGKDDEDDDVAVEKLNVVAGDDGDRSVIEELESKLVDVGEPDVERV